MDSLGAVHSHAASGFPPGARRCDAAVMTPTMNAHRWSITNIGGDPGQHRAGVAATHTAAWTQALAAGRAALLAGEIGTLAITVDDEYPTAFYTPGRDGRGLLDPAQLTAALVDLHQAGTAAEIADQLVTGCSPVSDTTTAAPHPSAD